MNKEEIEKAKNRIKILLQDDCDCLECIKNKKAYRTLLEYTGQLEKENKKLKKMTDEMIDEYEYNARCNLKDFCDEEMRKDKCIQDCRICIKQYFEKKVE